MRKLHDPYFKQAKREGHLARSIYKLEEIDRKDHVIPVGGAVIDVGACPGSWLEYILRRVGDGGVVCAVDLNPIDKRFKAEPVHFKKMDLRELTRETFAECTDGFDAVVSDAAPNTSGIRLVDQARSLELCEAAGAFALQALRPGGSFVCKIFESLEFQTFRAAMQRKFRAVRTRKPAACRDESIEIYLICLGFGEPPEERKERVDVKDRRKKGRRSRPY